MARFSSRNPQRRRSKAGKSSRPAGAFPGAHGTAIALDLKSPGVVFVAGAPIRVFRSRDGGTAWELVLHERPPPASVEPLARRVVRPSARTSYFYLGPPGGGDHVVALAIDPRSPDTVYAGSSGGIFKSEDFGATWWDASHGLAVTDVHALAIDPEEPSIVYAGTHGGGVHKSVDGARTWHVSSHGLDDGVIRDVAVDPLEPSTVYAATARRGLYLSLDQGRRWQPIGVEGADDVRALAFDPSYPLRLLAGTATGHGLFWDFAARAWEASPLRTRIDRHVFGGPWEPYYIVPEALEIRDLAFDPNDSRVVYGATAAGLFRDAGGLSLPVLTANVAAVATDPRDSALVWAGTAKGLWRSADAGATWRPVAGVDRRAAVFAIAVDPVVTSNVYVGLDHGTVLATQDSGQTWTAARLPEPPAPARPEGLGADVQTRAHLWLRRLHARGELTLSAPRAFPGGVGGGLRLRLRPRGPAGRSPEPRQPLADDLLPLRRRPAQPLGDPSLRARRHRLRAPGHPPARRLRAGRFGPAGLHPDERLPSERDRRLGSWPSRGLATQSRDELLESCAASSGRDRRKRSGG